MAFTEKELKTVADGLGKWLSKRLKINLIVAAYPDPDNGRVCLNVYPVDDQRKKRLRNQMKRNKATVFSNGTPLLDEQLGD